MERGVVSEAAGAGRASSVRRKLKKDEVAVLLSVVATVVVLVQRFLAENDSLLQASHRIALESSMQATTIALSRLQMMFFVAAQVSFPVSTKTAAWETSSSGGGWFLDFLATASDDQTWLDTFRMAKSSFYELLRDLQPLLQSKEENHISSPSADCKLGAGLYRLAHGTPFKEIGRKFGMSKTAACEAFYEVCKALEEKLGYLFDFPTTTEGLQPIIDAFAMQGMPNCCGVIGSTRFLVEKPSDHDIAADYYDFSANYSIVMQVVVDGQGRFLDISAGWPGSIPPASVLEKTRFFSRVDSSELLHSLPVEISSFQLVPQYLLGDEVYPLLPWLITPYSGIDLSETQAIFNSVHALVRATVGQSFGLLKTQWKLLRMKQGNVHFEMLPFIVAAACVLHNFLINRGEQSIDRVQPDVDVWAPHMSPPQNELAISVRDTIATHISSIAHRYDDGPSSIWDVMKKTLTYTH